MTLNLAGKDWALREFQPLETINKHLKVQVTLSIIDHITTRSTNISCAICFFKRIEVCKTRDK